MRIVVRRKVCNGVKDVWQVIEYRTDGYRADGIWNRWDIEQMEKRIYVLIKGWREIIVSRKYESF